MPTIPSRMREETQYTAHGITFIVRKIGANTWFLKTPSVKSRARFGNKREITEDVAHTIEYGVLPRSNGPRWF